MTIDPQPRPQPDWIVSPGEILAEALEERSMTQAELSRRTARPLKTINEIIKGKAAITPDTALQLEYVLGISASFWLNADREWQERHARERASELLKASAPWAARFPVKALVKHGLLVPAANQLALTDALLRFFGVTSPDAWERQWTATSASFRRTRFRSDRYALTAWLRAGEILASRVTTARFDAEKLRSVLSQIRQLTTREPLGFHDVLAELLADAGVALVLLPEFGDARVYGASYWLAADKVVVQLSARGRKDDQFWFSLFHELGHVLSGSRRETHLDLETSEGRASDDGTEEVNAEAFAQKTLVSDALVEEVTSAEIDEPRIRAVASRENIGAGILVGRLQREGKLSWRQFSRVKRTVAFYGEHRS